MARSSRTGERPGSRCPTGPTIRSRPHEDEDEDSADSDLRLAGRYRVHTAIQHANKGGSIQALDEQSNSEVIVKQARAHVEATLTGLDSQALLRAEAEALGILQEQGVCPKVDLFTLGDSLFLVEEALTGQTLADWVRHRLVPGSRLNQALPVRDVRSLAVQIVDVVAKVHAAGLRLGDLTPTNLMVCQDGSVRCIDLEGIGRFGAPRVPIGTPGYVSPEFGTQAIEPGVANDLYALGAVLFFLVTGANPVLLDDDDGTREDRLSRLFDLLGFRQRRGPRALGATVLRLMADDPAARWPLDRVRAQLAGAAAPVATPPRIGGGPSPRTLLADLVEQLGAAAMATADTPATADPRTVYAGAAGLLGVLTRVDSIGCRGRPHQPDLRGPAGRSGPARPEHRSRRGRLGGLRRRTAPGRRPEPGPGAGPADTHHLAHARRVSRSCRRRPRVRAPVATRRRRGVRDGPADHTPSAPSPSRQNTNTGKLTPAMMEQVFQEGADRRRTTHAPSRQSVERIRARCP